MDPSQLNSGDTVIAPGDLTVTTTIITGGINAAIILWLYTQTWWLAIAGFLTVIVIWLLAKISGLLLLFEKDAYVIVVKAGNNALPSTLKAAFIGTLFAMCVFGFAFAYVLGGMELFMVTWPYVTAASLIIWLLWGTLPSLL